MILNSYRFGGGGPTGSLFDEIMADSPFMYLRLGEASGTNADNEAGATDGTYSGSFTIGNAALYSGGPTSMQITANTGRCAWPGTSVPSLTAMTVGVVVRPNLVTGVRQFITRDSESGGSRFFQFRINGANAEFIKTTGTIQSVTAAHGMSAATAYLVHVRVNAAGGVTIFRNGSSIGTGTVSAANYGNSNSTNIVVGNRGPHNEGQGSDRFSEAFVIASSLSDARILAHAQAAGFA